MGGNQNEERQRWVGCDTHMGVFIRFKKVWGERLYSAGGDGIQIKGEILQRKKMGGPTTNSRKAKTWQRRGKTNPIV